MNKKDIPTIVLGVTVIITALICDILVNHSFLFIPLISCSISSALITKISIEKLNKLEINQIIRKEGPKSHYAKSGTPTMGGLIIIPLAIIIGIISTKNNSQSLAISFLVIGYFIIGALDDIQGLIGKTNKGLSVNNKLCLQTLIGIVFIGFCNRNEWLDPLIALAGDHYINVGLFITPLALFVLLAESNSTNLTDGLDGLASGCGVLVFIGLAIQLVLRESTDGYALATLSSSFAGSLLGFLVHNKNPAKIFMGDTGSLAIGAALGGISLISNSLWPLFIMGGIFFAESISVIIQVWVYKMTKIFLGKGHRIFKMAPLHHHFEITGKNETVIVRNFWIITTIFIVLGIILRPNH